MIFSAADYQTLHSIVFALDADGRPRYPGYRPDVVELPNGDGKADRAKRYAHVATKYLDAVHDAGTRGRETITPEQYYYLGEMLQRAHAEAERVARALGVPEAFMPKLGACALRVLSYPPGATSARHTDFDLFTLLCYRDRPEGLVRHARGEHGGKNAGTHPLDAISPGLHLGELGEIVGLGPATPHEVVEVTYTRSSYMQHTYLSAQHSIVYFALPSHDAVLWHGPSGDVLTVGAWLSERMARSRAPI